MSVQFTLIYNSCCFLAPLDIPWFVSGGWAIDMHLGRVTRDRCDLDAHPWLRKLQDGGISASPKPGQAVCKGCE
jgi:hypothetical protein